MDIFLEMSPWLLLGLFIAGLLHGFMPKGMIAKQLGNSNFSTIFKATILGIPLPLCSCGVIPTAVGLHKEGASKSATAAFLAATPQTGVDSISATYGMMGGAFAIFRPLAALIGGWMAGLVIYFTDNTTKLPSSPIDTSAATKYTFKQKLKISLRYGFITLLEDLLHWLLIGIALAACITVSIPNEWVTVISQYPQLEMFAVLLIAVPLYVCATGSIPIAMSLMLKGISPGSALVFLIAGPATNTATISVLQKSLGKQFTFYYTLSIIISAMLFGFIANYFFLDYLQISTLHSTHTMSMGVFGYLLAALFGGLCVYVGGKKYILNKKDTKMSQNKAITLHLDVEGMSCNHCKMSVEKNVSQLEGVQVVSVDLAAKKVSVSGDANSQQVIDCINELGFTVKN